MNKLDLIQKLSNSYDMTRQQAKTIVDLFFDSMSKALANGDRVEIRGLCSMYVKDYPGVYWSESKNRGKGDGGAEKVAVFQMWKGIEGTGGQIKTENLSLPIKNEYLVA
jgi:integration host factor subunit beta